MNTPDKATENLLAELTLHTSGAEFRRADLHIHSFGDGGSGDVQDANMTPENIVDVSLQEGLSVISITDHNHIGNIKRALEYAAGKEILVIPGIELSTPNGHLLVYCPTLRNLELFVGKLMISQDRKFCGQTMEQCLNELCSFGGIGIAAHIEVDSGFELAMPRYDVHKENLLKCNNLMAMEIKFKENEHWYTDRDDNEDRKRIHALRRTHQDHEDGYELPKVMNSDAHSLESLGRNASGNRKLTRLKMETLSFRSFEVALLDPSARVRIEDLIPENVPHFVGMTLEGGFLDKQVVHFSKNLTCIIGGRGAGKSTMLESLRLASGNTARLALVDSEVWPNQISLLYRDESGRQQVLSRSKENEVINESDSQNGITCVPIESYGQGETAETIQHCDDDPYILLRFLDNFIDIAPLNRRDAVIRQALLESQTQIERLQLEIATIPDVSKAKANAEAQLRALKEKDAVRVVEMEEKLARERAFRHALVGHLNQLILSVKECLSDKSMSELVMGLDGETLVVGQEEFEKLKLVVESFVTKVDTISVQIQKETGSFVSAVNEQLKLWAKKETETQLNIEEIRKELEAKGVKLDIQFIRKVTKDVTDFTVKLAGLQAKKLSFSQAVAARRELVADRRQIKQKIATKRRAAAQMLTRNLRATVTDYTVTVKFHDGRLSTEFEELLKNALNFRTSLVPRARLIASSMSPLDLLNAVLSGNPASLLAIKDANKAPVFSATDARNYLSALKTSRQIYELERCDFEDLPQLTITREFVKQDGSTQFITRDFTKLSLGQQQAILLSIMLFSKSNVPLIIDQPEDNLDSEFIYKTFVKTLRVIKERRQVIIVTHNANIAVLGDAELIIPLKATSDQSYIVEAGSIDTPATKTVTCTILEGSERAFKRRQAVYGY